MSKGRRRYRALILLIFKLSNHSSRHLGQAIQEFIEGDRIIPDTHSSRVINGVRYRCGDATQPKFANALRLHGRGNRVRFIEEDDVLMRNVCVDRNFIAGEIVIDEEAAPLVDHELFHQSRADPHGHRADDLTARGFRIENPT